MTASLAPSPWPMPHGAMRGSPWRFGREVALVGQPGAQQALQWRLLRNCSITARQLAGVYGGLCLASLTIATFFFVQGATLILPFTGAELLAVGLAFLVFARHAADRETLTLVGRSLQVEQCIGNNVARTDFAAEWLTVEPAAGQGSLVQLSARGQSVRVGRFLRPELRGAFARELRLALRRAPGYSAASADTDTN